MASIVFRAVLLVSIFLAILYFILAIWIHNKQSNNEPVSDTMINSAFWFAVILLIWYIGILIWIFATFLLDSNVIRKAGDLGEALIEQNGPRVETSKSIESSTVKRKALQELEDL